MTVRKRKTDRPSNSGSAPKQALEGGRQRLPGKVRSPLSDARFARGAIRCAKFRLPEWSRQDIAWFCGERHRHAKCLTKARQRPRSVVKRSRYEVARAGETLRQEAAPSGKRVMAPRAGATLHTQGDKDLSAEVGRCAGGESERTRPWEPLRDLTRRTGEFFFTPTLGL
jgi:hypothetical protein